MRKQGQTSATANYGAVCTREHPPSGWWKVGAGAIFKARQSAALYMAWLFLLMYPQVQSPIYFFLKLLALLDLSSLSVTVPQPIHNSPPGSEYISYAQSVLQVFFIVYLGWNEMAILIMMSYDHYVAICLPLHCEVLMAPRMCRMAVTAVWINGCIPGTLYRATTFSIRFCRTKIIHQFFCDIPQLLKLSCSDNYLGVIEAVAFMAAVGTACFIGICLSYVQIFSTVLRMLSAEGWSNVFSTCLPHLSMVSFYVSTGIIAYLKPTSDSATALDLILSIFYTVLPPILNSVIYSLGNEAMKTATQKLLLSDRFPEGNISS